MWQVRRHGRALYVFYRLPGAFPKKLTDLFNLGTLLMGLYNKKGIFGNVEDPEEGLREALAASFEEYEVRRSRCALGGSHTEPCNGVVVS